MIFPIGDDQVKGGSKPIFSYAFIAINILVFVLLQLGNDVFTYSNSAVPYEITMGSDLIGEYNQIPHYEGPSPIYLTLLYSIFMHGGWLHLIGNMLFLWVFADNIESTIGNTRFVIFYLLGGLVASLSHIATDTSSVVHSLGASGAIAACIGAYLVMFPKSKVKVLVFIKIISVPAFVFGLFWVGQQVLGVTGSQGNTAWWAHIGGLIFGVFAGLFFRHRYPKIEQAYPEYAPVKRKATRYNNRYITNRIK